MITGVCYIRGDADMLDDWFKWYTELGVDRFLFWTHGKPEENEYLMDIAPKWNARVIGSHGDVAFVPTNCKSVGIKAMLDASRGDWVVLADSDELFELPLPNFPEMVRYLQAERFQTFSAPQLERIARSGKLEPRDVKLSLHANYPLCVPGMRTYIGQWHGKKKFRWEVDKYILIKNLNNTRVNGTGYHKPPMGLRAHPGARGVTHHFMWRAQSMVKFQQAIQVGFDARRTRYTIFTEYLKAHGGVLPSNGSFPYSRVALVNHKYLFARAMRRGGIGRKEIPVKPMVLSEVKVIDNRVGGLGTYDPREQKPPVVTLREVAVAEETNGETN